MGYRQENLKHLNFLHGYRLPSESHIREWLHTLILAIPGISVSMAILETINYVEEDLYPLFYFCYKIKTKPLQSMITIRIGAPFMFIILSMELVIHIFIQVLVRKLDGPRGTVISIENQVVTTHMHRRLVINETGYFISAIVRSIVGVAGVHLISTVSKSSNLHIDNYGQLLIFCIPSFHFFVIPTILTVSSSQVRSSIPQCLKYFCQEIR